MLKLGLRSVLAHRLRFVLCTVAVLLGVAFVAGALIFTDTLSAALKKNFAGSSADITVTPVTALDTTPGTANAKPPTLSSGLADRIAAIQGVAGIDPQLLVGGVQIIGSDGKPTATYGVPIYAAGWPHNPLTAPFKLLDGNQPWGQTQLGLDQSTVNREGFQLGDKVKVITPARAVTATLTAITTPTLSGSSAGTPLVTFDPATAQLFLLGQPGWTSISVAVRPGQDPQEVSKAIATLAGPEVRVRTAAQVSTEGESALNDTFGGYSAVLLLFAALALFVGAFLIVNTFAMVVAQRSRELAMLRAIGASRGQVTGTVLAEALVIGAIGSTLGLLLGAGVAAGLQFSYQHLDLAIPSAALKISAATVIAAYIVGIGVTLAAAYPAARRAGKLPPVAAMRDDVTIPERSLLARLLVGGFMFLMAATLYAIAQSVRGLAGAILLSLGAALALLGVVLTSPLISRYAVRGLMSPFGRKAPVTLGRRNAERNPRRTSATASALMISLALISGLVVIASSAKASVDRSITDAIGTSELVVTNDGGDGFSGRIGDRISAVPGVSAVHRVRQMPAKVGARPFQLRGVDDGTLSGSITTKVESGSLDALKAGQAVLPRNVARTLDLTVGKTVQVITPSGKHQVTVGAVIEPNRQLNGIVVSLPKFTELGGASTDLTLYVEVAQGTDLAPVRIAVIGQLHDYPTLLVRDQQAYAQGERGPINAALAVVGMLLALAVLIAILGIVNTLALSVVERTREIGLLRAIGMDRPQLRRMLQVESIAISLLGALLGVLIGVLFGAAIQAVMVDDGLGVLDIPVLQLVIAVVVAAAVGVLAAVWPSRRAARLDVLRAIATE
ncbi:FtsX-like permease family protein [Kribbella qitaiheensis]|uniref:FtsX-like permease family protein n=1 Tax=Kribbella qitaiheensis TaxID=1544730 RepID=A0A7G6WSV2_9ACTN|nr:FtsX-like permease family protein [Kribbella qitaiheensis]QNE17067.1 FtsX-like permease family protein [Kribbella qitaiheensis]